MSWSDLFTDGVKRVHSNFFFWGGDDEKLCSEDMHEKTNSHSIKYCH